MATNLLLEGEDLEALLMRAHAEAGPRARIVRASKVRRGGVLGFFARQVFEVAVEVPDEDEPDDGEELLGQVPGQRPASDPVGAAPSPAPPAASPAASSAVPSGAPAAAPVPGTDVARDVVEGVLEEPASLGPAAALAARTVDPMPEPLGPARSVPAAPHDPARADDREVMKELDDASGPLPGTVVDRRSAIERAIEQDAPGTPEELARTLQQLATEPADEEPEPAKPPFRAGLLDSNGREILPASAFISTSAGDRADDEPLVGELVGPDAADDDAEDGTDADATASADDGADDGAPDADAIPGVVVYDLSTALATDDVATVVAQVVDDSAAEGDSDVTDGAADGAGDDVSDAADDAADGNTAADASAVTADDAVDDDEAEDATGSPADAGDGTADDSTVGDSTEQDDEPDEAPRPKAKSKKKPGKRKVKQALAELADETAPAPVLSTSVGITVLPQAQGWFPTEGLLNVARRLSPAERAAAKVLRLQAETSRSELAEQEEERREAEQLAEQEQAEQTARLAARQAAERAAARAAARAARAERGEDEPEDDQPDEGDAEPTPEGAQHWWMDLEVDEDDEAPRGIWSRIAAGRTALAVRQARATDAAAEGAADGTTDEIADEDTDQTADAAAGPGTAPGTAAIPGQRSTTKDQPEPRPGAHRAGNRRTPAEQDEPRPGAHRASTQRALAEQAAQERALAEQLAAQERAAAVREAADPMTVAEEFVRDEIAEDLDLPHDPAERSRSMLAQLRSGLRLPRHRDQAGDVVIPTALPATPSGLGAAAAVLVSGRASARDAVVVPAELMAALSGTTTLDPVAGIPAQRSEQEQDENGEPAAALEGFSAEWFPAEQIDQLTGEPLPGTPAAAAKAAAVAAATGPVVEDDALVATRRAARLAEARLAAERRALRALGVPAAWTRRYRGGDRLSAVLAMLERMPQADFDPDAPVVAVIGPAGAVELEAHRTALDLPVGNRPRPVVVVPGSTSPERSAALAQAQQTRPVVVAIERAGLDDVVSVRRALRTAQPDVVIALVDARDRLEDITRWVESFDRVDAIALDCALEVSDPAAALTLDLPVIRMDGIPVDRFGWATLLCAQLEALDTVR